MRTEQVTMARHRWRAAIIYIAAVALFLRFFDLPRKPLHHDEGVNALLLGSLVDPPHTYVYDPSNYHGPTLYYLTWLSVELFGSRIEALRMGTAAAGLAVVLMLAPLHRYIGSVGALAAAALIALSPGAVYFSRYFIHEMLLVAATLGLVVSTALAADGRRLFVYAAGASAGVMFATKETAIISAVVLLAAAVCASASVDSDGSPPDSPGIGGVVESVRRRLRDTVTAWTRPPALVTAAQSAAVGLMVALLFYTSFFTNWRGAIDALKTFAIWTKTGTAAHTQPWDAYLRWLAIEEGPLLVLGAAGASIALWQRRNRFAVFVSLWMLGTLMAYSVIPYKTPWLTLNVIVPLAICGGHVVDQAWRRRAVLPAGAVWIAALVPAGVLLYQSVTLSFLQYDNNRYPYVYAHTSRDVLNLVRDVDRIEALNPGSAIAVTSPEHFPLSWYLRRYPTGYWGRPTVTEAPLVVASFDQQRDIEALLGSEFDKVRSYDLRPGVRLILYVRRDLQRPPQSSDVPRADPPNRAPSGGGAT